VPPLPRRGRIYAPLADTGSSAIRIYAPLADTGSSAIRINAPLADTGSSAIRIHAPLADIGSLADFKPGISGNKKAATARGLISGQLSESAG